MKFLWITFVIIGLVVAAIAIEAYLKRNRRRPLSQYQPKPRLLTEKVELGQEKTNTKMVNRAHEKNERLEKSNRTRTAALRNNAPVAQRPKETRHD